MRDGPEGAAEAPGRSDAHPATFREVFGIGEFRAVWSAQLLSLIGDQFAVVALVWLVYEASGSPLLSAVALSVTLLPWAVGGPLLAGLADRLPRRDVMIFCDLARAAIMALLAVPGVPVWVLCVLFFVAELFAPPFAAARSAILPDILAGDRYVVGTAIAGITSQAGQLIGLISGGLLVSLLAPQAAVAVNVVTFVVSAVLLRAAVAARPAARASTDRLLRPIRDALDGSVLILRDRRLFLLAGLGLLSAFHAVPEGLAVPYGDALGGGPLAAALMLAAIPAGGMVGSLVFGRWVPPALRCRLMGCLAVAAGAALIPFALDPGLPLALALLALSGMATAYQLAANAEFVAAVPAESRGQAFGLIQSLMIVGQGAAIVAAGGLAQVWSPAFVIALAGVAATAAGVALAVAWSSSNRTGGHATAPRPAAVQASTAER